MRRLSLLAAGLLLTAGPAAAQPARDKVNVLFIVSDDLNCQLGCYGSTVQTPNLDKLAARSVRFERAYCNYPVCNASRTSFLSGRYPNTTGVFGNATNPRVRLGNGVRFLPEHFKDNGYFTARVGKISHETFANSVTWDVSLNAGGFGTDAPLPRKNGEKADRAGVPFPWAATSNKDEGEPDGWTARKVAAILGEHKGGPFFIAAGFHKPHIPHTAPKEYFDKYPVAKVALPPQPPGHEKDIPKIATVPKYYPDLTEDQRKAIIAHYSAATTFMDAQVGVLLEAMDRLKLWDDTVVVFFGDHGWHLGDHGGFWAKMSLMEESARVPLLVAAPGKAKGVSPRLVELVDLYPTLTDLCGLKPPAGLEGKSFAPLLGAPDRAWDKTVYTVVTRTGGLGRSVRNEQFSYYLWPDGSEQLYDARKDPREFTNLAKDSAHAEALAKMKAMLPKVNPEAAPGPKKKK